VCVQHGELPRPAPDHIARSANHRTGLSTRAHLPLPIAPESSAVTGASSPAPDFQIRPVAGPQVQRIGGAGVRDGYAHEHSFGYSFRQAAAAAPDLNRLRSFFSETLAEIRAILHETARLHRTCKLSNAPRWRPGSPVERRANALAERQALSSPTDPRMGRISPHGSRLPSYAVRPAPRRLPPLISSLSTRAWRARQTACVATNRRV
jgi:hypothetical protein